MQGLNGGSSFRPFSDRAPTCAAFVTFVFPRFVSWYTSKQKPSRFHSLCSVERKWFLSCKALAGNSVKIHRAFRPMVQLRSCVGSCGRSTSRGLGVKTLQNKKILENCGCHFVVVVDECQTISPETSIARLRTHLWSTSQSRDTSCGNCTLQVSLSEQSQSKPTRWVRETCLQRGLRPSMISK